MFVSSHTLSKAPFKKWLQDTCLCQEAIWDLSYDKSTHFIISLTFTEMSQVRGFQESDAEICGEILALTPLWQRYGVTKELATQQLLDGFKQGDIILVVEQNSEIVGWAWMLPKGTFGRTPYLKRIVIREDVRSKGIGSILIGAIEAEAMKLCHDLYLLVAVDNKSAQVFYSRNGYKEVGHLPDFVKPGVTELLYRKSLK